MSRGIVPGAYVFFRDGSIVRALTLWIASALALASPWGLLWTSPKNRAPIKKAFRMVAAILASTPPPLGLIGWGNPLTAAGLFLPGTGWYGLAGVLVLYGVGASNPKLRRFLMLSILTLTPFLSIRDVSPEPGSHGLDTSFGRLASGSGDFEEQYERERRVFQWLRNLKESGGLKGAVVVVLPETIIGRMNPTTRKRWAEFFRKIDDTTIFVAGAEIPTGRKYDNVMVAFMQNGENLTAVQRIPVPFSMYRPYSETGANARLFSLGDEATLKLRGQKIGCLICYEQFLTWPFLSLMTTKPDVLIASANLWWCKDTSLPGIQSAAVRLWGALFNVPVLMAINR